MKNEKLKFKGKKRMEEEDEEKGGGLVPVGS